MIIPTEQAGATAEKVEAVSDVSTEGAMHGYYRALLDSVTRNAGVGGPTIAEVLLRVMTAAPADLPRTDIIRGSSLSAGTVSKATGALVRAGLITEGAARAERPGRPILPLRLGSDRWAAVGVHVHHLAGRPVAVSGVLTSLANETLAGLATRPLPPDDGPVVDVLVREIVNLIDDLAGTYLAAPAADGAARRVLGLGVELGAHVRDGRVVQYTNASWSRAGWHDVDLGPQLSDKTGLAVVIDNDINTLAVRELYRNRITADHFAVVAVLSEAVGGAIVVDRQVYRGGGGMAGEIGHLTVDYPQRTEPAPRRPTRRRLGFADPCPCGEYGHVDSFAPPLRISGELHGQDFDQAARAAARDSAGKLTPAGRAFQTAGRALGRGLAGLVNTVNPSHLLLILPPPLATAHPDSAAAEYRDAAEEEVDRAFSTGATDARASQRTLTVEPLADDQIHLLGAQAAAVRVVDQLLADLRQVGRG